MTLNKYFISLGIATLFSWLSFVLIILKLNPFGEFNVSFTFSLFYLTLFLALTGTFTIMFSYIHSLREGGMSLYAHVSNAFRQGILLSILCVGLLVLQGLGMLTWWDGLLLAGGILCLELLFLAFRH